jgi:release factor glutamine methyltransferase
VTPTPTGGTAEVTSAIEAAIVARLRAAGCVFAEDEARLLVEAAGSAGHLDAMVARRVAGEPLEPLLGWVEFRGQRIAVDPGVFVPRQRTGFLVEQAVDLARRLDRSPLVAVDLCCGSGAAAASLGTTLGGVELYAADIDPAAVACARRNLAAAGAAVFQGDLYLALPGALRGRVDILIANAPYVPTAEIALMPPEARDHEPRVALDGGRDGLDVVRRVIAGAPEWLAPGGHLLVEAGTRQAPAAVAAAVAAGLTARIGVDAELGATAVVATRPVAG